MSDDDNEQEEIDGLQPRQVAALAALLTEPDVPHAAKKCKVPASTIHRWMAKDETFKRELRQASKAMLENATRQLAGLSEQAIGVIRAIMSDQKVAASVRLRAALGVLGHIPRLSEFVELEDRLAALESAQEARR